MWSGGFSSLFSFPPPPSFVLHNGGPGCTWAEERSLEFWQHPILLPARETRQEKLSVYCGLHLRRGISSPTPHHWGHQSLQQHTWHLDSLWRYFITWCLLHDLISQRLPMLHKTLFYIPRNTCSLPCAPISTFSSSSDVVNRRSRSQEPQLSRSKWFITSVVLLSCFCDHTSYLAAGAIL